MAKFRIVIPGAKFENGANAKVQIALTEQQHLSGGYSSSIMQERISAAVALANEKLRLKGRKKLSAEQYQALQRGKTTFEQLGIIVPNTLLVAA